MFTDLTGLAKDQTGFPRGVEDPLIQGQHHGARALGLGVAAQQVTRCQVANFNALGIDAHQHLGANGRRASGVAAVIDTHAAVITHGALDLIEILHPQQRQGFEVALLIGEHGLHLAPLGAVYALGRPVLLPVSQEFVLRLYRFKASPLQGGGLGVTNGVLHRAFAVGVTYPRWVGHHAVMGQCGGVDRVEVGFIQVRL